jgi:hypothetical protein
MINIYTQFKHELENPFFRHDNRFRRMARMFTGPTNAWQSQTTFRKDFATEEQRAQS